jgi:hypothetical protein
VEFAAVGNSLVDRREIDEIILALARTDEQQQD